jgi:hypothetical protein
VGLAGVAIRQVNENRINRVFTLAEQYPPEDDGKLARLICRMMRLSSVADSLTFNRIRTVLILVENTPEGLGVARRISAVGLGHEPSTALLVSGILRQVGMDAFGHLTEKALEFRRRVKVLGFGCFAVGFIICPASLFAVLYCLRFSASEGLRRATAKL